MLHFLTTCSKRQMIESTSWNIYKSQRINLQWQKEIKFLLHACLSLIHLQQEREFLKCSSTWLFMYFKLQHFFWSSQISPSMLFTVLNNYTAVPGIISHLLERRKTWEKVTLLKMDAISIGIQCLGAALVACFWVQYCLWIIVLFDAV